MRQRNPRNILLLIFSLIILLALVSVGFALVVTQTSLMDEVINQFFDNVAPSR